MWTAYSVWMFNTDLVLEVKLSLVNQNWNVLILKVKLIYITIKLKIATESDSEMGSLFTIKHGHNKPV